MLRGTSRQHEHVLNTSYIIDENACRDDPEVLVTFAVARLYPVQEDLGLKYEFEILNPKSLNWKRTFGKKVDTLYFSIFLIEQMIQLPPHIGPTLAMLAKIQIP